MWNTDSQYIIYVSLYSAFNGPFCQMSVVRSFKRRMWSSGTRNREAANGEIPVVRLRRHYLVTSVQVD